MNGRKELDPGLVRNVTVTGLAPSVAAGAVATREADIAPGTRAENAVLKKGNIWVGEKDS